MGPRPLLLGGLEPPRSSGLQGPPRAWLSQLSRSPLRGPGSCSCPDAGLMPTGLRLAPRGSRGPRNLGPHREDELDSRLLLPQPLWLKGWTSDPRKGLSVRWAFPRRPHWRSCAAAERVTSDACEAPAQPPGPRKPRSWEPSLCDCRRACLLGPSPEGSRAALPVSLLLSIYVSCPFFYPLGLLALPCWLFKNEWGSDPHPSCP